MHILRYTPLKFCGAMGPQIEDKLASFLHNLEDLSTTVFTNSSYNAFPSSFRTCILQYKFVFEKKFNSKKTHV